MKIIVNSKEFCIDSKLIRKLITFTCGNGKTIEEYLLEFNTDELLKMSLGEFLHFSSTILNQPKFNVDYNDLLSIVLSIEDEKNKNDLDIITVVLPSEAIIKDWDGNIEFEDLDDEDDEEEEEEDETKYLVIEKKTEKIEESSIPQVPVMEMEIEIDENIK